MKRTILIGFALVVASSSAYAYTVTDSYGTTSPSRNIVNPYYYALKCNSGAKGQVSSMQGTAATNLPTNYYLGPEPGIYKSTIYKSLDAVAKVACGEK